MQSKIVKMVFIFFVISLYAGVALVHGQVVGPNDTYLGGDFIGDTYLGGDFIGDNGVFNNVVTDRIWVEEDPENPEATGFIYSDEVFVGGRNVGEDLDAGEERLNDHDSRLSNQDSRINANRRMIYQNRRAIAENRQEIARNRDDIEENRRGIAMVAAMTNMRVDEDKTHSLDFNISHFSGEQGLALSYGFRVNTNVQLNAAAATTTEFEEGAFRGGVNFQW